MPQSKLIVITGVSKGLGRALATDFAKLGHTVIGCARASQGLTDLRKQLGPPHQFATVDVSSGTDVAAWAKEILASAGSPDLLINNAAVINRNEKLWKISAADVIARQHRIDHSLDNLALACDRCNLHKGPNLSGIDPVTGTTVELFHPRKDVWENCFREEDGQIIGLTAAARATVALLSMNATRRVELRRLVAEKPEP